MGGWKEENEAVRTSYCELGVGGWVGYLGTVVEETQGSHGPSEVSV